MSELNYANAIREATDFCLEVDQSVLVIGLGVPDPKGIFGTTTGLQDKYGVDRVMDMPLAENGMTGVVIGASLNGYRPILTHQRVAPNDLGAKDRAILDFARNLRIPSLTKTFLV